MPPEGKQRHRRVRRDQQSDPAGLWLCLSDRSRSKTLSLGSQRGFKFDLAAPQRGTGRTLRPAQGNHLNDTMLATGVRQSKCASPFLAIVISGWLFPREWRPFISCPVSSHSWSNGRAELPFQSPSLERDPGPATSLPLILVISSPRPERALRLLPCWPSAPILSNRNQRILPHPYRSDEPIRRVGDYGSG
jgi:hypothetical protein